MPWKMGRRKFWKVKSHHLVLESKILTLNGQVAKDHDFVKGLWSTYGWLEMLQPCWVGPKVQIATEKKRIPKAGRVRGNWDLYEDKSPEKSNCLSNSCQSYDTDCIYTVYICVLYIYVYVCITYVTVYECDKDLSFTWIFKIASIQDKYQYWESCEDMKHLESS